MQLIRFKHQGNLSAVHTQIYQLTGNCLCSEQAQTLTGEKNVQFYDILMVSNHFKPKNEESWVFVEKYMSAKHSEHVCF